MKLASLIVPFLKRLAVQTEGLLLPASLFGLNENFVRIGVDQQNMSQGLEKLIDFINKR